VLQVLEDTGRKSEESLFVGDGAADFWASQGAQVEFIGVAFGYSTESELRHLGAARFIRSFSELSQKIQEVDAARS
jgi:phosphoglycolate phosphatase-like HAD superfamily hydrolase